MRLRHRKAGRLRFFRQSPVNRWLADAPPTVHFLVSTGLPSSGAAYALTRICDVRYMKAMESVFDILAEPNRRAILTVLAASQHSVGEIKRHLRLPQPTVSKHLRVLREAGFVESTVDAQRRLYRLKPEPFQEVDAWLAQFRRFWSVHVDALERHLDRMDRSADRAMHRGVERAATERKTGTRTRSPNRQHDRGE